MFCCSASAGEPIDEIRLLSEPEKQEMQAKNAKVVTCCQRSLAACCCLKVEERDDVAVYLVLRNESLPPSCFQRWCMCVCAPQPREPSGLEMVPELRGLAGVAMQHGEDDSSGSLLTMKWGEYDPASRVYELALFDGFYGSNTTGVWTEPVEAPWCCLMNMARCANYSYRLEFSEDFRTADIRTRCNPCVLCCCCCPWIPAWFTVPKCCLDSTMKQHDDSQDGRSWERHSSRCGGTPRLSHHLLQVFDSFGQTGPYKHKLAVKTPKQVMITF